MSRKLALIAAAFTFTAIVGAGAGAHAQAQSDMIPPGGSPAAGAYQSSPAGTMNSRGVPSTGTTRRVAPAPRPVAVTRPAPHAPRMSSNHRVSRNMADHGGPNGAYMGGGGVYERAPDGSLRPVQ